ncbi:MAG: zinc ribbon domain-containing protein [Spirochaetaceae bacterium]|nr:zinc ribbon domain-containing protein [Spirochaetaceae bacterium]
MKRPRYYCEHCGAEVKHDARVCPRCGRFFSSVKCPKCGHSGRAEDFRGGCPICGYADPANAAPDPFLAPPETAAPLPIWVYFAALGVLGLAVALLLKTLS